MADKKSPERQASLQLMRTEQFRRMLVQLPEICQDYFIDIEPHTTILTRINYAYDLRVFFDYIRKTSESLTDKDPREYTVEDLASITARDVSYYMEYLNLYTSPDDTERMNSNQGKKRKLVAVRTFFKFLHVRGYLASNVTDIIHIPKISEKPVVYLDMPEVDELLKIVSEGVGLTEREKKFHALTVVRDMALVVLLLGTGIRVSECVGLNVRDINMSKNTFRVQRKGGKVMDLYFGEQVRQALSPYLDERSKIDAAPGHENALFLSLQKKRMTSRSVENLVEKYTRALETSAHITPHKFRSTFGTALYRNTGDIYLVADVLGHKDVNVTKRHYASVNEERRRLAAEAVTFTVPQDDLPLPEASEDAPKPGEAPREE